MSTEDHRALTILESSACMVDSHHQLALPWRYNPPCLPNSRPAAEHRLNSLRRLLKEPSLKEKYCETVYGFIAKGHARKAQDDQIGAVGKPLWYLPHHLVFHNQKLGKFTVVFDCTARSAGTSLNDQLLHDGQPYWCVAKVPTRTHCIDGPCGADVSSSPSRSR